MSWHQLIEQHWQQPRWWLLWLLRPLSRLFQGVVLLRRQLYVSGCLKACRLPVPVVVVGNIHAGGAGKTPITVELVSGLQRHGVRVGVISRGYGRATGAVRVLQADDTAAQAGDEPLLIYRRTGAPTAVGADRYAAGLALLVQHPELQLIVADDGLQHYALARDVEIAVYPAAETARSPDLLPNGSLREPRSRLRGVDAVVFSNSRADYADTCRRFAADLMQSEHPPAVFHSRVAAGTAYRFRQPQQMLDSGSLKPQARCAAVAAIARPERFFDSLREQGFPLDATCALPDHAALAPSGLPAADYVFVTEKDAVKLSSDAPEHIWVLPIQTQTAPDLAAWLLARLQGQLAVSTPTAETSSHVNEKPGNGELDDIKDIKKDMNDFLRKENKITDSHVEETIGMKIAGANLEGNIDFLKRMAESGQFDPLEVTPNDGWNYLHRANIWNPSPPATIRFYLDKGVEVNARDCYGMTPLHYALRVENADAAIVLLEAGADPNIPNIDNLRPLSMAGYVKDRLDVLELMLKSGGNVHNIINDNETILESWKPRTTSPQWEIDIYELMKQYA